MALEEVVHLAAVKLGVPSEASRVKAELYKILLYGEGAYVQRASPVSILTDEFFFGS